METIEILDFYFCINLFLRFGEATKVLAGSLPSGFRERVRSRPNRPRLFRSVRAETE
jgi:hypothetical protein